MALRQFSITKTLTRNDTNDKYKKVVLPIETRGLIPLPGRQHFLDLLVEDSMGHNWSLRFYTRPDGSITNPVITAGWPEFVGAKGILAGDKLIFSGHQIEAVGGERLMQYKIKVMTRHGFSFQGEDVYEDLENLPRV